MTRDDVARDVAAHFPPGFLRAYVRSKVATDPVYDAVFQRLRSDDGPLIDIGCGVGVLEIYLRLRGFGGSIIGLDHDARKIEAAREATRPYRDLEFRAGDAMTARLSGTVLMLDLLHYFTEEVQQEMLRAAARDAQLVILRDAVRDGSWRYRATYAQEAFARRVGWLKADRLIFSTRQSIVAPFRGFAAEIIPMWGRTPFNNYLFVFRRSSGGMTNE